ncbi:hypothetical protein NPIL_214791 [Nephila pilipes]|uniref:Uncharacterized protein n=1 Tax=Nephila pilipes TaxID=299642 RepID=A0A8X6N9J3_NEPPI|nr:hypothetical protein NPIL_214791 [Nephila pilipes]
MKTTKLVPDKQLRKDPPKGILGFIPQRITSKTKEQDGSFLVQTLFENGSERLHHQHLSITANLVHSKRNSLTGKQNINDRYDILGKRLFDSVLEPTKNVCFQIQHLRMVTDS